MCGAPLQAPDASLNDLTLRVRQLVADGQKIEAIRVLREATGIGLAEAKALVESELPTVSTAPLSTGDIDQELLVMLQAGQKIEAIKRYRERTGRGLKESKDYVDALQTRAGLKSQQRGCAGVVLFVLLAVFSVTRTHADNPSGSDQPTEQSDHGWSIHRVDSDYQSATTEIKVLQPDHREPGKKYSALYVLPVEANNEDKYGNGLAEIKRLNLHNKYDLVCVAPTFARLPWYADHPTDLANRQESYFLKVVVPLVERTYPVRAERQGRLLLGFSKSGWGAWSLLVRHPDVFSRAAAWDAPLEMPRFDQYGAGQVFGTQDCFENYRVLPALRKSSDFSGPDPRLILLGYDNFRSHHESAHQKLQEWKISHFYRDGPQRKHVWNSGWVEEAVERLVNPVDP